MSARLWTAANVVMSLLFAFAAVVQLNDPDPIRWLAIYLAAAAICVLEIRRGLPGWVPAALAATALAWSGYIATRARGVPIGALFEAWEMRNVRVEEAREMYGLALVAVWMIVITAVTWSRRRVVK